MVRVYEIGDIFDSAELLVRRGTLAEVREAEVRYVLRPPLPGVWAKALPAAARWRDGEP